MKTETKTILAYYATALFYGDTSGLDDEEESIFLAMEESLGGRAVDMSAETYFGRCAVSGAIGDVADFLIALD